MKNKKGFVSFIVILIIAVIFGFLSAFLYFTNSSNAEEKTNNTDLKESDWGYIASVNINGIIEKENNTYNQKWLLDLIHKLEYDKRNVGMVISINSPGGNVYQSDEIYLALEDYKSRGKPIYTYMEDLAASGAYYISVVSDKIYANRNTLTGSIGVICGQSVDATELLSKIGIKSTTIHSGKNKTMGHFDEPFTQEQKDIMQSISDECYEQFTSIVALERNIPIVELKKIADGRIFTANQAKKNGLIDEISSYEQMLLDFQINELDRVKYKVKNFKYEPDFSFMNYLIDSFSETSVGKVFNSVVAESRLNYPAYFYKR